MKKIVSKINVAVIAVLLGVGLIAVQSAFKPAQEKRTDVYWRFNSNDATDARTGAKYDLITTDPDEETCNGGDELPCVIKVPSGYNTQPLLDTYLHSNFMNSDEVIENAYATKPIL